MFRIPFIKKLFV